MKMNSFAAKKLGVIDELRNYGLNPNDWVCTESQTNSLALTHKRASFFKLYCQFSKIEHSDQWICKDVQIISDLDLT